MAVKYYISSNKYSLQERVTKKHGKVYDIRFNITTLDGVEKQKHIGGFESKTLAKQGYLDFVQQNCELVKNNPLKKKNQEKQIPLTGDLIRQYIASLGNQNKKSVVYDKNNIFRNYILPNFDKVPISKVTKESLYIWQDELWSKKNPKTNEYFSWRYLVKIRGQFSTFLSWVEERYGYKNNFLSIKRPKRRQAIKEMQFWTREQFEQFISCVDDPTYHALFTFMFYTGRRKGEIFALFKTDVKAKAITFNKSVNRRTFGEETWEITTTKADKTATIPVCKTVQMEIERYIPPKKGKFYFGGEAPLPPTTVTRKFNQYIDRANLPQIRIHDLRHSYVSMLIHLGANLMVVADLISDTVEQVTKLTGIFTKKIKLALSKK